MVKNGSWLARKTQKRQDKNGTKQIRNKNKNTERNLGCSKNTKKNIGKRSDAGSKNTKIIKPKNGIT